MKLKTYAESQQEPIFNWNDFLQRAVEDKLSEGEQENAKELAGDWVTCACGNQCSILDRHGDGEPTDTMLYHLGLEFDNHIRFKEYDTAIETLKQIEIRSTTLLQEKLEASIELIKGMGFEVTLKEVDKA
jgi:hypothetical protein